MSSLNFTKYEDELLVDIVLTLSDRGLYVGIDFWERVRMYMSHDENTDDERPWLELKYRFDYLMTLGPDLKTDEELYFEETGRYMEDDFEECYDEEDEEDDNENCYDEDSY